MADPLDLDRRELEAALRITANQWQATEHRLVAAEQRVRELEAALRSARAIVEALAAFDPQDEDGGFCLFCAGCALSTEQPHAPSCPWRRAREAMR